MFWKLSTRFIPSCIITQCHMYFVARKFQCFYGFEIFSVIYYATETLLFFTFYTWQCLYPYFCLFLTNRGMTATLPGSADLDSPSYSNQGTLPAYSRSEELPSTFFSPGTGGYTNHALSVDDDPDLKRELSSSPYQTKTNPLIGRDEVGPGSHLV